MIKSPVFKNAVIFVKDIEVSKQFYTGFMNQEIEYDFGDNVAFKGGISIWKISPSHEIADITSAGKINSSGFELYLETESIDEIADKIVKNSIKMLHPLKTEPWGQKTIRIFDPDGHLIEIGESLETFIKRIYRETGSVEETSRNTGVPQSLVEKIIQ